MPHFDVEDSKPTQEAEGMQKSKAEEVESSEKEIKASELNKEKRITNALNTTKEPTESGVSESSSGSLYSLLLLIQTSALKRMGLESPNEEEKAALKESSAEIEARYHTTKFLNPIVKLVIIVAAPFVRQMEKLGEWYAKYKESKKANK